ncbi:ABC transporter ATP-binding protein [Breoghania sp. L-A4]|uniref:ABC transporter ATP-binding protein n=1 Tax=Breoghania sp. L-A4 TaxID=2304600 RepID=UPI000E35EB1D|nr:ABC transporter ATP-binding protein [Breoghania sp. L-A4]
MLEAHNLTVSYGPHRALENVSVAVGKGEICVILGANGAGKTTLLKALAGLVSAGPASRWSIGGRSLAGMKPHDIVEKGIALVPEGRGIFGDLTVAENLQLGAYGRRARSHENANLERVLALFPKLAERRAQIARTMSGGEQQMVAIGRALMSNPDILMLDEPSLGLSPLLCVDLFKSLKTVGETGVGILLVEQNAKQSLAISDRGYLLENGAIIGEDTASALAADPAVQRAYLGDAGKRVTRASIVSPTGAIDLPDPLLLPSDPHALSEEAAVLAIRAGEIHSAYIATRRKDLARPSGFSTSVTPGLGSVADMARRASEIQMAHIRARRAAREVGSARPDPSKTPRDDINN